MAKYDKLYMDLAIRVSKESNCPRKQVGAVVVTTSQALFPGFNGHASGGPNTWEDTGEPNPEVIHAEHNCLNKMLEEGVSAKGSTIYTTLSCCLQCAKQLVGAKVKRVVYLEQYRDTSGLQYLEKYGVIVDKFDNGEGNEFVSEVCDCSDIICRSSSSDNSSPSTLDFSKQGASRGLWKNYS